MTVALDLVTRVLRLKKPVAAPAAPGSGVSVYVDPATGRLSFARPGARALLENPAVDISAFPARPANVIDDGTSATNWGFNQADAPTFSSTFNAIKSSLKPSNNGSGTPGNSRTYAKVNGGTPLAIGSFVRVLLDFQYSSSPGGVKYDLTEFAEVFVASGNDGTGPVVTVPIPSCIVPNEWVNALEIIIYGTALTQIGSVGLRHTGSPTPGQTSDKVITYIRNVRFDEATEIDIAAIKGTGTIVIPSDFTPTGTQWYRPIPSAARFVDCRPGHERQTLAGGVRSLRDHFIPEDGSRDVTQDVNRAISDAAAVGPNTLLTGVPGAKYLTNGTFGWRNLISPRFDGMGCRFYRTTLADVAPSSGFGIHGNQDFDVGNFEWIGFKNQLTAGAGLTTTSTNRLDPGAAEGDDTTYTKVATGWVADANTSIAQETTLSSIPASACFSLNNKTAGTSDISASLPKASKPYRCEASTSYRVVGRYRPAFGASSTLVAALTGTPATFDVVSAPGTWPSGATQFVVQIQSELILVTRSTNTLTVITRGYNGSVSADHAIGLNVTLCTPRACETQVNWYKSDGTASSHPSDTISMGTEVSNNVWLDGSATVTSPPDVANGYAELVERFKATLANETHYFDTVGFKRTTPRTIGTTTVGTIAASGATEAGYLATFALTAPASPALSVGQAVTIVGNTNSTYNDNWKVIAVPDATHFTAYMDSDGAGAGSGGTVQTDALLVQPGDELSRQGKMYGWDEDHWEKCDIVVSGNGSSTATLEFRVIDDLTERSYVYQTFTVLSGDSRVTKQFKWRRPNLTEFERISVRRIDATGGNVLLHHMGEYGAAYYSNRIEFGKGCAIPDDEPDNLGGKLWGVNVEGAPGSALGVAAGRGFSIGTQSHPFVARAMGLDLGHTGGDDIEFWCESYGGARSAFDIEPTGGLNNTIHRPKYHLKLYRPKNYGVANNPWGKLQDAEFWVFVYYAGITPFDSGGRNGVVHELTAIGGGAKLHGVNCTVESASIEAGFEIVDGAGSQYTDDTGNAISAISGGNRVTAYIDPATVNLGYQVTVLSGVGTSQYVACPNEVVSPPQIVSDQNNYNPTNLSLAAKLRLDLNANRILTGLQLGWPRRRITIVNLSAFTLTLSGESASSTAANRFAGANYVIAAGRSVDVEYDGTAQRWRVVG